MRKFLLVAAAVPLGLMPVPGAGADDTAPGRGRDSACRPPDINLYYDTFTFGARMSLSTRGCPSREDRRFKVTTTIARLDNDGGRNSAQRSVTCRPDDDSTPDDGSQPDSCHFHLFLDHPETETAQYDVKVSYPGAAEHEMASVVAFCTSDGNAASCEQ
jgi:hypothetical protein